MIGFAPFRIMQMKLGKNKHLPASINYHSLTFINMKTPFYHFRHGLAMPLLGLFAAWIFLSGCEGCAEELVELCDENPSTQYLVSVRNVNYAAIGSTLLNDPVNHNIEVCPDHFAANTPAGHQFLLARDEINRIEGSQLHYTSQWTGITHRDPVDLVPANPTGSIFDYVDISQPLPNACNLQSDLSFAIRTCKFDMSGGGVDHFNIMAKSTNYQHFSDPASDDYPYKHGILHELSHAFGMVHTGSWDAADQQYISTIQGNMEYLSALDVAYLRENYPQATFDHRNYVASSLTRFNGTKGKFEDQNPDSFYLTADGFLKDCETGDDPWFYVAWFNTGNLDGESGLCGTNEIYLRKKYDHSQTISLHLWKMATMPYLSQDQWQGQVQVAVDNPASIDFNSEWELVFEVNNWGILDEYTDEDNLVFKEVELFDAACN